jgi:hypothetical protein
MQPFDFCEAAAAIISDFELRLACEETKANESLELSLGITYRETNQLL